MSQWQHPKLPSVLPSRPALQDGMPPVVVVQSLPDVLLIDVIVDSTHEQVNGGMARITNSTE